MITAQLLTILIHPHMIPAQSFIKTKQGISSNPFSIYGHFSQKWCLQVLFIIGSLIYLNRRLKLASVGGSRWGLSGDTHVAHVCR